MDLNKLTTSDRLIAGGGIAYLIFMFLKWHEKSGGGITISQNGWSYFLTGILPLILIAIMVAQVLITRFSPETTLPALPLPWAQVHLVAGFASALLVLLRLVIPAEIQFAGVNTNENYDRSFGLFLALVAAIAVAVGGLLKSQEGDSAPPSGGGSGSAPF